MSSTSRRHTGRLRRLAVLLVSALVVVACGNGTGKKPVAGAEVYFLANMFRLVNGQTDSKGRWSVRVPVDAKEWSVFARKGNVGFDYALAPIEPMLAMHKAVKDMMEVFLREGSTDAFAERLTPFEEFNRFVGLGNAVEEERRFAIGPSAG